MRISCPPNSKVICLHWMDSRPKLRLTFVSYETISHRTAGKVTINLINFFFPIFIYIRFLANYLFTTLVFRYLNAFVSASTIFNAETEIKQTVKLCGTFKCWLINAKTLKRMRSVWVWVCDWARARAYAPCV